MQAWVEFLPGKKDKPDVALFALNLSTNLYQLHEELRNKTYIHGPYKHFRINYPKPRDIHKPTVRDRLLHHAIVRVLCPFFDRLFVFDSYSSRLGKGTHLAMDRFAGFGRRISRNHTRTTWVLKCDIRKFFASIDHVTLKEILARHIRDQDMLRLLSSVIDSFNTVGKFGVGLPLGNLTSQLLVNIYMDQFDQHVKHRLKVKYYIRYADDFVFLSHDKFELEKLTPIIHEFLQTKLKLALHPKKLFLKTLASGLDFLGWVHFPDHRVLRTSTKHRMLRNLGVKPPSEATLNSYLGMLGHGNGEKLKQVVLELNLGYSILHV